MRPASRRDAAIVVLVAVVLTAVGESLAGAAFFFPAAGAAEAHIIDRSFTELFVLSVPVMAVVLAVMGYALVRFRAPGPVPTDAAVEGEPQRAIGLTWLGITTGLALISIVLGLQILDELGWYAPPKPDLVVQVKAQQWSWTFTYPQYEVTVKSAQDLLLPVGRRVRFEITSTDVIHSFWIPAFRMKLDAVPGQTTAYEVTPDRVGATAQDGSIYRVQCAEMCGTGHPRMSTTLSVVSDADFERRVAALRAQAQAQGGR